jgi:hypothetical protein
VTIIIRRPWTRQPQAVPALSQFAKLHRLAVWHPGSGPNVLTGSPWTLNHAGMTRNIGLHGTELRGNASSQDVWASTPLTATTDLSKTWTAAGRFYVDSAISEWILLSGGSGNSSPYYYWHMNVTVAGALKFYAYGGSNKTVTSATGLVPTARYFDAACSYLNGAVTLYLNGVSVASGTAETLSRTDAFHRLNVGFLPYTSNAGYSILGRATGVALFHTVLPAGAISALASNPWLLADQQIPIPSAAAAAGIYTLSNATYAPGSLTATAVTPRVTVTVT